MTEETLNVPGISCGHCKKAIEDALSALAGVVSVEVTVETKTVSISYDGAEATLAAIIASLDEQGYEIAS